jgi:hypothetical protein
MQSIEANSLRNYRLATFHLRARLEQLGVSPGIKSLRDEIAILRALLEQRLEQCKDTTDFILQSGPISDLKLKIEKLVASCHHLEGSMGQLLDKQAILQFASVVIDIISEELKDTKDGTEKIAIVGDRIMKSLGDQGKPIDTRTPTNKTL